MSTSAPPTTSAARTIQIFLPFGEPRGLRIAEITTRVIRGAAFPRSRVEQASTREELAQVGLYFLVGGEATQRQTLYVGEAEDCIQRVKQHNSQRDDDYWHTAIVFISNTRHFTKSHARYLEWASIQRSLTAGRFEVLNKQIEIRPFVTEPLEAELNEILETVDVLSGTFGFPIFDPLVRLAIPAIQSDTRPAEPLQSNMAPNIADQVFECRVSGIVARGVYTDDGLVILRDSHARADHVPSIYPKYLAMRENFLADGTLSPDDNGRLRFTRDVAFNTPSAAAQVVTGSSVNGWISWKTPAGRTLDELVRVE